MGMDVSGINATTPEGEYFRNNVWWWHPLWDYCQSVAPEICAKVKNGHSNDGDGLDGPDSLALAKVLLDELNTGRTAAYSRQRAITLKAMPSEPCEICGGTGKRAEPPSTGPGKVECNGCEGTGKRRPWATNYPFSVENVREFVKFLSGCGGFRIY